MVPLLLANPSNSDIQNYVYGNDRLILELFKWLDNLTPYLLSEAMLQNNNSLSNNRSDASRLSTKPRGRLIESLAKHFHKVRLKTSKILFQIPRLSVLA